jgi:hypothetical protein
MDDYPYATLGADGCFRCDGLPRPRFPTLFRDVLRRFGYTGLPAYRGRLYRQLGLGWCKVHVDVPAHPTDPTLTAWFTTARGDDLDDTLERAAHQALTDFCERHQPGLDDTTIALLPVRGEGNAVWSARVDAITDPEFPTHHAGWTLTARYAQHVSSMLREATATSAHLHLRLEERVGQRKAQDRVVKTLREGNRELIQKNVRLETRIRELNDELMRTYRSRDFKTDSLDDARTRLQHTQDDLIAAQSYVHYLETELHERDEQLEASQAQVADLQNEVEHLQGLIPPEPEEPEEDPEEIEGMSGLDDE